MDVLDNLQTSMDISGKDKNRVNLACGACRSRKIKCDGAQPICATCVRRKNAKCVYDEAPKRRGPDRRPRQRPNQVAGSNPPSAPRPKTRALKVAVDSSIPARLAAVPTVFPQAGHPIIARAYGNRDPERRTNAPTLSENSTIPSSSISTPVPARYTPISHPDFSNKSSVTGTDSSVGSGSPIPPSPSFFHVPQAASPHSSFHFDRHVTSEYGASRPSTRSGSGNQPDPPPQHHGQIFSNAFVDCPGTYDFKDVGSVQIPMAGVGMDFLGSVPTTANKSDRFQDVGLDYVGHTKATSFGIISDHNVDEEDNQQRQWQNALYRSGSSSSVSTDFSDFLSEPSLHMSRANWWSDLVKIYNPDSELGTKLVMSDITHLFRVSNYFLAFINVPLFLSAFHLPEHRMNLQPSLVYAVLALSTFLKSSNLEEGYHGREKALILRTMAQMSLEQSINCNFVTPGLAQAALILALFEVCCHPEHSEFRVGSMLQTLDSIIQMLGFLELDVSDPAVARFENNEVPVIQQSNTSIGLFGGDGQHHHHDHEHDNVAGMGGLDLELSPAVPVGTGSRPSSPALIVPEAGCTCALFKISSTNPQSAHSTPFWVATPGWNSGWSLSEIRYEEQRRLVWSALTLATAHVSYANALNERPMDLAITKPWMYRVLFPGETLYRGNDPRIAYDPLPGDPSPKESVWALYARSQLLYSSCVHVKYSDGLDEFTKGDFAVRAWLETERIEAALNEHTCDVEKSTMYHGREYLFNTQILVSSQFSRHVPHPTIGNPQFHREKAVAWLTHQQHVANFLLGRLGAITGMQRQLLSKRPYFIFWFFSQVARYLNVWAQDQTLTIALELAKTVLPAMEYLMSIYPSDRQRDAYIHLHGRLDMSCVLAGIEGPRLINLDIAVKVI